jgi:esterase/lipase
MKIFGVSLGTGLAIGVGAAILTPVAIPMIAAVVKPMAKAGIKSGILLYEKGRLLAEETKESMEDLTAEAKSELHAVKPKTTETKTSKSTS